MKNSGRVQEVITATVVVLISVLFVTGCSIEKPQAPSWDTTLTIPVVNRTYSSGELLKKLAVDDIKIDSAGNSFFYVEKRLDSMAYDDLLNLSPQQVSFQREIGKIKVPKPEARSVQIAFSEYVPLISGVVPATGMWVEKSYAPAGSFSTITLMEGGIIVTATNNTGFPLDSLHGSLHNGGGEVIGDFGVPIVLAASESYVDTLPLAGKTLVGETDLEVYFHTAGGLALSLADRSIDLSFGYTGDVYASAVTGKVDAFSTQFDHRQKLGDTQHFQDATFSTGRLSFNVVNHLPVATSLSIEFPDITQKGGPLWFTINLPAGGSTLQQQNLSGWVVQPEHDSATARITADVYSSGGVYVTLNSTD